MSFSVEDCRRAPGVVGDTEVVCCSCSDMVDAVGA